MIIQEWTNISNLPLGLWSEFVFLIEESEVLDLDNDDFTNVIEFIEKEFISKFGHLMGDYTFQRLVDIDCYEFDKAYDEEEKPGYSVDIYFHENFVRELVDYVLENHPDYVLKYIA